MKPTWVSVLVISLLCNTALGWSIRPTNGLQLNWADPLAQDLAYLWMPLSIHGGVTQYSFTVHGRYSDWSNAGASRLGYKGVAWSTGYPPFPVDFYTVGQFMLTSTPSPDSGKTLGFNGVSFRLDNTDDYFAPYISYDAGSNFSFVAYFKLSAYDSVEYIAADWEFGGPYYGWYVIGAHSGLSNQITSSVDIGASQPYTTDTEGCRVGIWQCVVVTYDNNLLRLYVDAVLRDTTACSGDIEWSGIGFAIGKRDGLSEGWFNGDIAEFRIYNRTLLDEEIANLSAVRYEEFKHDKVWMLGGALGAAGQVIRVVY